jgi:capsular polysaccharide transport system permease protein
MDNPRIGSEIDAEYRRIGQDVVPGRNTMLDNIVQKVRGLGPLFLITVFIPTLVAILYFGLFASDVYISESRFVVRSPDKPATTGLGVLLKSTGFTNGGDEIFAAQDYVVSRDALEALNRNGAFAKAYGDDHISMFDRFNSLGSGGTFEDLFKYYQKKVKVDHDTTSSITTLTVRAYTPEEARKINEHLLEMAEGTVNRLNTRGRQDLIRFAQAEVEDAKEKSRAAALALSAYRNREGVVDPEKQAQVQLQMISKLQDELIATKTQLLQLRSFTPENPQIEVFDMKVKGLQREIDEQLGKVAGDRKSLSSTAAQYQRLALEAQFADKNLAGAMASLEDAKNEARRKQAYVERIVQPNMPDEALEPRRWRGVLATLALGLVGWGILSMLFSGIKEHQN